MRTLAWAVAALTISSIAACSDSGTDMNPIHPGADAGTRESDGGGVSKTCGNSSDVSMQLGTGVREYQAVADGDTVYLYRGPQGGYMIYLSVRARGLDPSDVRLCYTETFTATGREFGRGCWEIILTNDLGDGMFERVGVWGQVDTKYWTIPGAIRGADAAVYVTLTDKIGCQTASSFSVHISEDPGT